MRTAYTCAFTLWLILLANLAYSQQAHTSSYHLKAQFAGDIGLISVGIGRNLFSQKLDTDIFLGYLPESVGGDRIITAALKAAYVPFNVVPIGVLDWQVLRTGLQLGHTFGNNYFAVEPQDKYPEHYYKFSTALHLYYFVGGEVNFKRIKNLENMGVYYEVGSVGEYIISYITNPGYLSPGKIFHLALGLKYTL